MYNTHNSVNNNHDFQEYTKELSCEEAFCVKINDLAQAAAKADTVLSSQYLNPPNLTDYSVVKANNTKTINVTSDFFKTLDSILVSAIKAFGPIRIIVGGGAVRDTLLNRQVKDIDLFIEYDRKIDVLSIKEFANLINADPNCIVFTDCDYGKMAYLATIPGGKVTEHPVQLIFVKELKTHIDSFDVNLSKVFYSLSRGLTLTREFITDYSTNQLTVNTDTNGVHPGESTQANYVKRVHSKYPDFTIVKGEWIWTAKEHLHSPLLRGNVSHDLY